ncbi:MAG TPA: ethylbenzene dehydrogenase-related protein [Candidatus Bathyarchaeia archaeon]|nr:ethylbenzene dehydrogenase-related protein [Candidatus Bathyarchaeia archaeon]
MFIVGLGPGGLRIIHTTQLTRAAQIGILILVLTASLFFATVRLANAQGQFMNITSYLVSGAPNYASPGNETFWNTIPWTNVSLSASVTPGGGHTPYVLVKSANDGFNLYVLFQWPDQVGPSFGSSSEIYTASNGTLLPLNPEDTSHVVQLYYNSTYYYPDRVAVLWYLGSSSQKQQSPAMQLGSSGAITGGAAEIWHWQSNPTDNNPNDSGFPGGYTDPSGRSIYPADNVSFAEDDYTNTTGFYVIGGSFGAGSPNLDQYTDPYIVHVGNSFSNVTKTWTVEMVRSFTTQDSEYRVQLQAGSTYYVAFAVWNGLLGESAHIKSVSAWYSLTTSNQSPPSTSTTSSAPQPQVGIPADLAAAVGLGLLLVGVIIGLVARSKTKD